MNTPSYTPSTAHKRFAITATDRYLPVLEAFVAKGWLPHKLFTVPTDERLHSNKAVIARAQALGMQIQLSRLDDAALLDLQRADCDALIVASYPWRIGDWRPYLRYAVNFHPSPLPSYRGPFPQVWAILDQQAQWGVSCHKLEAEFDSGDILAQTLFAMPADECLDSLDLKIQMAARTLAEQLADDFERLWQTARPQEGGHYVGFWSDEDRTLDFTTSCAQISRQLRAFGALQCLAQVNGVPVHVKRAITWHATHQARLGSVVHADGLRMVVACQDGYVALLEWSFFSSGTTTGTPLA